MERQLSPAERARQILIEIEQADQRKNTLQKQNPSPSLLSEEGSSPANHTQRKKAALAPLESPAENPLLTFDSQSIVQGFIFSEILGKPVSKRRGR